MAVLYSALLLNEPIDRYSVIGLSLIMGGIFVQMGGLRGGASLFKTKTYCLTKDVRQKNNIKIRMT